jgi:uncharacterized protein YbbC (DUF1343 family)
MEVWGWTKILEVLEKDATSSAEEIARMLKEDTGSTTTRSHSPPERALRGLDALIFDIQDVGSRYYTYPATMLYCMEAAARAKLAFFVLDRPNPVGGVAVEGPALRPGFGSFCGVHDVAVRHGLTVGELAGLYREERELSSETHRENISC